MDTRKLKLLIDEMKTHLDGTVVDDFDEVLTDIIAEALLKMSDEIYSDAHDFERSCTKSADPINFKADPYWSHKDYSEIRDRIK